ncbi:hypothetical protein PCASD_18398 [Puccinia coronata f. sp. avenae]|uniref:Uncharacterized protein n=1 Tax=Puccinia coronata f. sp. avenae TaxID=200324 RepID=A0A2N5TVB7_9BASI|nr:hypothetical protein PCASD_18398 [Puccinia coronata f. sp. avenae]
MLKPASKLLGPVSRLLGPISLDQPIGHTLAQEPIELFARSSLARVDELLGLMRSELYSGQLTHQARMVQGLLGRKNPTTTWTWPSE